MIDVYLVDGTYELFRHFFGQPSHLNSAGVEVGATRGVLRFVLRLLEQGVTHVGVATDHVIESFRNKMWPGYKTSAGVPVELMAQFPLLEGVLVSLGVVVWPMVELEADDALASAAVVAAGDPLVHQVLICSPDKDLAQCVADARVVQLFRRRGDAREEQGLTAVDEDGVWKRFGVAPSSIPDYLALVGDSSDGYPGLPGWGPKSAATLLGRYARLESIPASPAEWEVKVRGADGLAATLLEQRELAELFRDLATLRIDRSLLEGGVEALGWKSPTPDFAGVCNDLDAGDLVQRAEALVR